MKKSQVLKTLKTKLTEITQFKQVKRGNIYDPSQYPILLIRVPIAESYYEQLTNKKIPNIQSCDILLDIINVYGNGVLEDEKLDELVELVKEKMNTVSDGANIIGIEWQHDEEWENSPGDNTQGMTVYYTLQYKSDRVLS